MAYPGITDAQLDQVFQHQAANLGIERDDTAGIRTAAAIAVYQQWIRNTTEWESTHSSAAGLSDGQMMRANVQGVSIIDTGLRKGLSWSRIATQLMNPNRKLPNLQTLRHYLGDAEYTELSDSVLTHAELLDEDDQTHGRETTLHHRLAGMITGSGWFGLPAWTARVETFCIAVDDPNHPHWKGDGKFQPGPRPTQITDTAELRRILLTDPSLLDNESADWCVKDAALRYI